MPKMLEHGVLAAWPRLNRSFTGARPTTPGEAVDRFGFRHVRTGWRLGWLNRAPILCRSCSASAAVPTVRGVFSSALPGFFACSKLACGYTPFEPH